MNLNSDLKKERDNMNPLRKQFSKEVGKELLSIFSDGRWAEYIEWLEKYPIDLLKNIENELMTMVVWDKQMDRAIKSIIKKHVKELEK